MHLGDVFKILVGKYLAVHDAVAIQGGCLLIQLEMKKPGQILDVGRRCNAWKSIQYQPGTVKDCVELEMTLDFPICDVST